MEGEALRATLAASPPPLRHYWAPDVPGGRKCLPVSGKVATGRSQSPSLPAVSLVHTSHPQWALPCEPWLWGAELLVPGLSCLSFAFPPSRLLLWPRDTEETALGDFSILLITVAIHCVVNITIETKLGGVSVSSPFYRCRNRGSKMLSHSLPQLASGSVRMRLRSDGLENS